MSPSRSFKWQPLNTSTVASQRHISSITEVMLAPKGPPAFSQRMSKNQVPVTFQFAGDQFPHAWFFNRFRIDTLGDGFLVTTALVTAGGGTPVVNGFAISRRDLEETKQRTKRYFEEVSAEVDAEDDAVSQLVVAPSRVYPINHINLSRIDRAGEICLYRYTMNTLLNVIKRSEKTEAKSAGNKPVVPCYPVVMFRSDINVQVSLMKELFSL